MATYPASKDGVGEDRQLERFPRSGSGEFDFLRKSSEYAIKEKEKELRDIRNYWQREYKVKVSEVGQLEAALKDAIESRYREVEELKLSHEIAISHQNSEISELRRTLGELMGTREEILGSAEKSTESKLRAKNAEVMRLKVWLEEAKKSNMQGREVLSSCQKRLSDKEAELEEFKKSNEEIVKLQDKEMEKLKGLLSEVIAEKDRDSANTKFALDSLVQEKENQIDLLKDSSNDALKQKDREIEKLKGLLSEVVAAKDRDNENTRFALDRLVKEKENQINLLKESSKDALKQKNKEIEELKRLLSEVIAEKEKETENAKFALDSLGQEKENQINLVKESCDDSMKQKEKEMEKLKRLLSEVVAAKDRDTENTKSTLVVLKESSEDALKKKDKDIEKLKVLISGLIAEKERDSENAKCKLENFAQEKENQIGLLKVSSDDALKKREKELQDVKKLKDEKIKLKDNEMKQLQFEFEKLTRRAENELEVLRKEKETEVEQLKESLQNLNGLLEANEEEKKNMAESLRAASGLRKSESERFQERFKKTVDEKNTALISLDKLAKEQRNSLQNEYDTFKKHQEMAVKEKARQIEELTVKMDESEARLLAEGLEKDNTIANLQSSLEALEESNESFKKKMTSTLLGKVSELENAMKALDEMKAVKEMLESEVNTLVRDIHARDGQVTDLSNKFEEECKQKQALQQKFESATQDLDNWKSAMKLIEEERNSLEKDVKRLGEDLEVKSNKYCELEYKIQTLESARENLEEVVGQLRKENSEAVQTQTNLEFVVRERDREQNLLKEKLSVSEKKLSLEIEQKAMREENSREVIEDLKKKNKAAKRDIAELKAILGEKEREVGSLSRLLKDAKQEEHKLQTDLEWLGNKFEVMKGKEEDAEIAKKELREKIAHTDKESRALESSLSSAINMKQQEIEDMQQRFDLNINDQKNELTKQEACWKEALKAKDELVRDLRQSFGERVVWKEIENQQLATSLEDKDNELISTKETLEKSLNEAIAEKIREVERVESVFREKLQAKDAELSLLEKTFEERLKENDSNIKEITAASDDVVQEKEKMLLQKEKQLEEAKNELNMVVKLKDSEIQGLALEAEREASLKESEIKLAKEKTSELENQLDQTKEELTSAQRVFQENVEKTKKEIEYLRVLLEEGKERHEMEMRNALQTAAVGFKERENVAEKMKMIIQENAIKYRASLQRKDDKISALKKSLENSKNDNEDLQVNLTSVIQESGESEAKLNSTVNKLEDERTVLEDKVSELTKSLEKLIKEKDFIESSLVRLVEDSEKQQKENAQETKKMLDEFDEEKKKAEGLEKRALLLTEDVELKNEKLCELTATCDDMSVEKVNLEKKLEGTRGDILKLEDNLHEFESSLKLLQSEKVVADQENQGLLQELQKQNQLVSDEEEKISLLMTNIKMWKKNHFEAHKMQEKLEENVVTLQIKLKEKEEERNALEQTARNLKHEAEAGQEEVRQHLLILENMNCKKSELENQIQELTNAAGFQETNIRKLQHDIQEALAREAEMKRSCQQVYETLKEKVAHNNALASSFEGKKAEVEKFCTEYENFKDSVTVERGKTRTEIYHLKKDLEEQEKLLHVLTKEKESLLGELEKSKKSGQSTKQTLESHIENLKGEKETLNGKLASLDRELNERCTEIAELNTAVSSAEVSKDYLTKEIENLQQSFSAKEAQLCEVTKSLEAVEGENSGLKNEIESLQANLNRELHEKKKLTRNVERLKRRTLATKQEMETKVSEKDQRISRDEHVLQQLKRDNEGLQMQLTKYQGDLKADKKCVVSLLEEKRAMEAEIKHLIRDKEILKTALKDMDPYPLRLKSTQESLEKTRDSLKLLKEQLKEQLAEKASLEKNVKALESKGAEIKCKLDVQSSVQQAELQLVKKQLEEKNKEFYDLKIDSTKQEMHLRDAQLKMKDLESSLKNDSTFHRSIARRNDELQQENRVLRDKHKSEVTSLKQSLDDAIGRWDASLQQRSIDQPQIHCVERVDVKTMQKMRNLYLKVSELETQLDQEKNDHILSLANARAEIQHHQGMLRAE